MSGGEVVPDRGAHVVELRARRVARSMAVHPSAQSATPYDREGEPAELVPLTALERQLIAGLLRAARAHLPSPRAVDEAIALLLGGRS